MTERICGHEETTNGHPCQNPAGKGTGREIGPCHIHLDLQGRPSKFTDETARMAIEAVRDVFSIRGAALKVGVADATMLAWLDRSPDFVAEDGSVKDFSSAFARAQYDGYELLAKAPLLRSDDIDGSHARFLLSTVFDHVKTERKEHLVDDDADLTVGSEVVEVTIEDEPED